MLFTIVLWVLAAVLLLPALALLYFILGKGWGGGKLLDLLIAIAILGGFGILCLYEAIQRTFR